MRQTIYQMVLLLLLVSCKDEQESLFDKSSDERAAEAIASLKSELVRPANGWKVKYRPESQSGSFWVLMKFNENNEVTIKSDLAQNNSEFFEQTITYRIDNSLGLELILESYSFFSFLFEQDQATFQAEYEFNYASKMPDNSLVFVSKTDFSDRTTLIFQEASANDEALLGKNISANILKFPSSARIAFDQRNVAVYLTLDNVRRTANFNYVSLKTSLQTGQPVSVFTGYYLQGDSIVFDQPLDVNFNGARVYVKSLLLQNFQEVPTNICPTPSTGALYSGRTSLNEPVIMETSLFEYGGAGFRTVAQIYAGPVNFIFNSDGQSVGNTIRADITGALYFVIYNNLNGLNAMGFLVENPDGSTAIIVKDYTATWTGNMVQYTFAQTFRIFGTVHPDVNINNITKYLDLLTEGGKTYAYRVSNYFFELYNPCSGYRFYVQIID
jgi:hypothetical protein